jgi:hypothetical protein
MKKKVLLIVLGFVHTILFAQSKIVFNAYKPGLSIRDKPSSSATVISKIPYGEKLTLVNPFEDTVLVVNEGLGGYWNLIEYKGKKGYVVGIYLLDFVPPKATVKNMKEYFAQLSQPAGPAVIAKRGTEGNEMYSLYKKQLYKNGCEYHEATFYESGFNTYFLPEVSLQQGFILVRLIAEFKDVFAATDAYPSESKKVKVKREGYESEKEIKIIKPGLGGWAERILVTYEEGAYYEFEMYQQGGQLIISFGGGV